MIEGGWRGEGERGIERERGERGEREGERGGGEGVREGGRWEGEGDRS
jgi:hypothetical protein